MTKELHINNKEMARAIGLTMPGSPPMTNKDIVAVITLGFNVLNGMVAHFAQEAAKDRQNDFAPLVDIARDTLMILEDATQNNAACLKAVGEMLQKIEKESQKTIKDQVIDSHWKMQTAADKEAAHQLFLQGIEKIQQEFSKLGDIAKAIMEPTPAEAALAAKPGQQKPSSPLLKRLSGIE